jgi:hypothetical protein
VSPARFALRVGFHFAVAISGHWLPRTWSAGYVHFEKLGWREAFLNSAILPSGMRPVGEAEDERRGKYL